MKTILFLILTGAALATEYSSQLTKVEKLIRQNPSPEYRVDYLFEFADVPLKDFVKIKPGELDKLKDKENDPAFKEWYGIKTAQNYFYVGD